MSGPGRSPFPPGFVWGAATASYQIEGAVGAGRPRRVDLGPLLRDPREGLERARRLDRVRLLPPVPRRRRARCASSESTPSASRSPGRGSSRRAAAGRTRPVSTSTTGSSTSCSRAGSPPTPPSTTGTCPRRSQDRGGWPARETAEAFAEYVERVVARLGDRVRRWVTHNEPWVVAWLGHGWGKHAPGLSSRPRRARGRPPPAPVPRPRAGGDQAGRARRGGRDRARRRPRLPRDRLAGRPRRGRRSGRLPQPLVPRSALPRARTRSTCSSASAPTRRRWRTATSS